MSTHRSDDHADNPDPPRVLIGEDLDPLREALAEMLRRAGFRVVGKARDGAELLEMAGDVDPEVILTDLRMPNVDGVEVARVMKLAHPSIPVIIFSGHDEDAFVRPADDVGVFAFLVKGCPPSSIIGTLRMASAYHRGLQKDHGAA